MAELGVLVLPIHYAVTEKGNYSDGIHASVCYISIAFYLFLCVWLLKPNWVQLNRKIKEVFAMAFDNYCSRIGYEEALPVIWAWFVDECANVRRAAQTIPIKLLNVHFELN